MYFSNKFLPTFFVIFSLATSHWVNAQDVASTPVPTPKFNKGATPSPTTKNGKAFAENPKKTRPPKGSNQNKMLPPKMMVMCPRTRSPSRTMRPTPWTMRPRPTPMRVACQPGARFLQPEATPTPPPTTKFMKGSESPSQAPSSAPRKMMTKAPKTPRPTPNPTKMTKAPKTPDPTPRPTKATKAPKTPSPTTKRPTPTPTVTPPPPAKVITIGDSYACGTGIHKDGDQYDTEYVYPSFNGVTYSFTTNSGNRCWRELDTTPGPRYARKMKQESVFLACGGAQLPQLNDQFDYLLATHPLDHKYKFEGSSIIMTAGGNDLRTKDGKTWPELLRECILEAKLFKGCHDDSDNELINFLAIQVGLTDLFSKMVREASGATIRIMGYPKMMQRDPGCSSVTGISKNEADWIDRQVVTLNQRIALAVAKTKLDFPSVDIQYVPVFDYLTIGACGNGAKKRHVHDKRLHTYWPYKTSPSSFHPSQKGYDKYYDAFVDSL